MNTSPLQWIPAGESITIRGHTLNNGLVYIKTSGHSAANHQLSNYAIDTLLPVLAQSESIGQDGPSELTAYTDLSHSDRLAYLRWLSQGAKDPDAPLGFPLLYLVGIEYRALCEYETAELNQIFKEVLRLRATYGHHAPFLAQTDQLIDIFLVLKGVSTVYTFTPRHRPRRQPRISTKLALGQAAAAKAPLSADWALYWILEDADTHLRKTVSSIFQELKALFRSRYKTQFPEGFILPQETQSLSINYTGTSHLFEKQFDTIYPDTTSNPSLLDEIRPVFEACCAELEPFRLATESSNTTPIPIDVLALLPTELAVKRIQQSPNPFLDWTQNELHKEGHAVVGMDVLIQKWLEYKRGTNDSTDQITIDESNGLANVLDCMGIGIEPDGRHSYQPTPLDSQIVLFRTDAPLPGTLSETYWRVLLILKLVAAVAHADNEIAEEEITQFLDHIRNAQTLSQVEITRLSARLYFLLKHPPSSEDLKEDLEKRLAVEDRKEIANYALVMALADGRFVASEVAILKKIYGWLGLKPDSIYADLNDLGTDSEPVVVHLPQSDTEGYTIPHAPDRDPEDHSPIEVGNFKLDMEAINKKMRDTQRVNEILEDIFIDEGESIPEITTVDMNVGLYAGLQEQYACILEQLLTQPSWSLEQYNTLAKAHGLMPEGIPEILNDWAIDTLGDILIEVDDTVEIFHDVWEEYSHEQKEN